jgi:chemotaxis-related protein WspB
MTVGRFFRARHTMQLLTFTVESELYAIESRRVIEVLPLVPGRPIPRAPAYVRGVFTYRGRLVPLVDLGKRLADAPLRERLSTRVIVVTCAAGDGGTAATFLLGIVAENVLAVRSTTDSDASLPPLHVPDAPYLGRLLRIDDRTVQLLAVEHLLPPALAAGLIDRAQVGPEAAGGAAAVQQPPLPSHSA